MINRKIKTSICLLALSLVTFGIKENEVKVNAESTNELNCISSYSFSNENLGKDDIGNFDLKTIGNVQKGEKGIVLDGKSCLYFEPVNKMDVTDQLDQLTITMWAKESSIGANHRFMLGTGCAYSEVGFGMGFYSTNSAYIVPNGNESGYAANFVTSQNDTFGPKVDNYNISTEWNMFTIMLKEGKSYFGVNGHLYQFAKDIDMSKIKNLSQTLTIGGIVNNAGSPFYNGFSGEIADVRIYNDILSEEEFSKLFQAGINGNEKIMRDNDIAEITDSNASATNEYDYEIEATRFTDEGIIEALNQVKPTVKLTDGTTAQANVVYNKITNNGASVVAEGIVSLAGVANTLNKKVKVFVGKGGSDIYANTTFTDHMVLQRNKKVKVFGYGGTIGKEVKVTFNGQEKTSTVNENGWAVYLDEMEKNNVGQDLVITSGTQQIVYKDVLVGEVLLCSGQSNMNISINYIYNKDKTVKRQYMEFDNYSNIRVLDIPYAAASEPTIYETQRSAWKVNSSIDDVMNYSAYAMAVASSYQAILGDVPVGVITASVGGSCIEEWIDPTSMSTLPSYAAAMNKVNSQYYNSFIYNLGGYSIGGIIWYQGEANSQPSMVRDYIKQFNAYVKEYRRLFEDENLPIVVQQLVQFDNWVATGNMRQAQWNFMKDIENVYTVCGIDTGSMEVSDGIHSTEKWVLGKRATAILAMINNINKADFAVNNPYGISPSIESADILSDNSQFKIVINSTEDGKLHSKGQITGFEVKVGTAWKSVDAEIVDGKIVIYTTYSNINAIRYNFANGYENGVFVYNEEELPLAPSQTIAINVNESIKAPNPDEDSSDVSEEPSEDISEEASESSKYTEISAPSEKESVNNEPSEINSEASDNEPTNTAKKGCKGSMQSTLLIPLSLLALAFVLRKKKLNYEN